MLLAEQKFMHNKLLVDSVHLACGLEGYIQGHLVHSRQFLHLWARLADAELPVPSVIQIRQDSGCHFFLVGSHVTD